MVQAQELTYGSRLMTCEGRTTRRKKMHGPKTAEGREACRTKYSRLRPERENEFRDRR